MTEFWDPENDVYVEELDAYVGKESRAYFGEGCGRCGRKRGLEPLMYWGRLPASACGFEADPRFPNDHLWICPGCLTSAEAVAVDQRVAEIEADLNGDESA